MSAHSGIRQSQVLLPRRAVPAELALADHLRPTVDDSDVEALCESRRVSPPPQSVGLNAPLVSARDATLVEVEHVMGSLRVVAAEDGDAVGDLQFVDFRAHHQERASLEPVEGGTGGGAADAARRAGPLSPGPRLTGAAGLITTCL